MKQIHRIDLTKIEGDGDVSCPQCGTVISPDDSTEEKYSVLEPKVSKNGLKEVVIYCNNCGSHIRLTGFSLLQEIA
jgi:RNase P subunit RPR2